MRLDPYRNWTAPREFRSRPRINPSDVYIVWTLAALCGIAAGLVVWLL